MPRPREDPSLAASLIPERPSLPAVRQAAAGCRACDLWRTGTQTVFGEGPASARLMLVGEQPGDAEDRAGRPFVGPAGRLLDEVLAAAGIDRGQVYVTNVVKHFKWKPQGKRRIHQKPNAAEITACRPWLETEVAVVEPTVIVCLGATAAQAFLGKSFKVTRQRGEFHHGHRASLVDPAPPTTRAATPRPSASWPTSGKSPPASGPEASTAAPAGASTRPPVRAGQVTSLARKQGVADRRRMPHTSIWSRRLRPTAFGPPLPSGRIGDDRGRRQATSIGPH